MLKKIIPWAAYITSVLISWKFCAGFWVVGPVFALCFLAANYECVLSARSYPKHLIFILASTLIYALVFLIADKGWKFHQDSLDAVGGSLTGGVVLGSILMPFVHAKLFGIDLKTAGRVSLWLVISWYAVVLVSLIDEWAGVKFSIDYTLIGIILWQGIYFKRLKLS